MVNQLLRRFINTYFYIPFFLDALFALAVTHSLFVGVNPVLLTTVTISYITLSLTLFVYRFRRNYPPVVRISTITTSDYQSNPFNQPPTSWTDAVRKSVAERILSPPNSYNELIKMQDLFKAVQEANALDLATNDFQSETAERCLDYLCQQNNLPSKNYWYW